MKNKIVIFNLSIITLALVAIFLFGISINKTSSKEQAEKEIVNVADIYASNYNEHITENVPEGIRVTVVDATFKVIADSEDQSVVGTFHTNREELESALNGTPKIVSRYSSSLNCDMVYYAKKVTANETYVFVRVAIPVQSVNAYAVRTVPTMIYVLLISLVISFIASIVATNGIIKPIKDVKQSLAALADGSFNKIPADTSDKEVNEMLSEINDIGEKLKRSFEKENADKEKLDYVLSNVTDGIVVIGQDKKITIINTVAGKIFGIKEGTGKDFCILSENPGLIENISQTICDKKERSFEFEKDGKIYFITASALKDGLTVAVLSDVTAVKNSEKIRSEFFANASHELKTPLTAIKGFNEIIELSTKEDSTKEFCGKIEKEVSRILALLSDMLDLSKLEVKTVLSPVDVNLKTITDEVIASLSPLIANKNLTVNVNVGGVVKMEKEHALELVKNIVENAVRYNNDGGSIDVFTHNADGRISFIVKDTGIGIEQKHLGRIFERFYRVNKSRSRETGGTGLGLSIVKHICTDYNVDINIKSKYGVGTEVTVTFPEPV